MPEGVSIVSKAFLEYIRDNYHSHLEELKQLLRFQSVSGVEENQVHLLQCAEYLVNHLRRIGFENVSFIETGPNPVVYAEWLHATCKPTVLVYGHYDVQPPGPLELWETPPFEPNIRGGKIYARGASDDKGQIFTHLKVFETILATTGALPVNIKICFEGEEEIGSPHLIQLLKERLELFRANYVVVSDTAMLDEDQPSVCCGLRGLIDMDIHLQGAKHDLPSGLYGGAVQNPAKALVKILSSLIDETGRVTVEGFYRDVVNLDEDEKQAIWSLPQDDDALAKRLQVSSLFGESGYTTLERTWTRPTIEINEMHSGRRGASIIPSEASAQVSCRLVMRQNPQHILECIREHITRQIQPGVKVTVSCTDSANPYHISERHPLVKIAARAYGRAYDKKVAFVRAGGSIPIVEILDCRLHVPIILMGFGLPTANVHGPNEHFSLDNMQKAMITLYHFWNGIVDEPRRHHDFV